MRISLFKPLLAVLVVSSGVALAHSGASGIVKKRMDLMSDIAAQMKAIGTMLNGKSAFDPPAIEASARRIADHGHDFVTMFPEGSNATPSEARDEIWTDPEGFQSENNAMRDSALALASAAVTAKSPLDITAPFGDLGKSCKSCHAKFRLKK